MEDEPTTEELRLEQVRRFRRERDDAEGAYDDLEARQHERRAQRAEYLAGKLAEREQAERER